MGWKVYFSVDGDHALRVTLGAPIPIAVPAFSSGSPSWKVGLGKSSPLFESSSPVGWTTRSSRLSWAVLPQHGVWERLPRAASRGHRSTSSSLSMPSPSPSGIAHPLPIPFCHHPNPWPPPPTWRLPPTCQSRRRLSTRCARVVRSPAPMLYKATSASHLSTKHAPPRLPLLRNPPRHPTSAGGGHLQPNVITDNHEEWVRQAWQPERCRGAVR